MTSVIWNEGHESGFSDQLSAQRFVDRIGKVVAPNLNFVISEGS